MIQMKKLMALTGPESVTETQATYATVEKATKALVQLREILPGEGFIQIDHIITAIPSKTLAALETSIQDLERKLAELGMLLFLTPPEREWIRSFTNPVRRLLESKTTVVITNPRDMSAVALESGAVEEEIDSEH